MAALRHDLRGYITSLARMVADLPDLPGLPGLPGLLAALRPGRRTGRHGSPGIRQHPAPHNPGARHRDQQPPQSAARTRFGAPALSAQHRHSSLPSGCCVDYVESLVM